MGHKREREIKSDLLVSSLKAWIHNDQLSEMGSARPKQAFRDSILEYIELNMPVVYRGENGQRSLDIEVWGGEGVRHGDRELGNVGLKVTRKRGQRMGN